MVGFWGELFLCREGEVGKALGHGLGVCEVGGEAVGVREGGKGYSYAVVVVGADGGYLGSGVGGWGRCRSSL